MAGGAAMPVAQLKARAKDEAPRRQSRVAQDDSPRLTLVYNSESPRPMALTTDTVSAKPTPTIAPIAAWRGPPTADQQKQTKNVRTVDC
jgi:hypothetical protein